MRTTEHRVEKKNEIMEQCFKCYCKNGLNNTGIKALGKACNMASGSLYSYFDSVDDLVLQSTAYCMKKVEDEFMEISPKNPADVKRFLEEAPYWAAKNHGPKYRFMYQVYTSPKYYEAGKEFFHGVTKRYTEYAKLLAPLLGLPWEIVQPMIFIFVRASVHYVLFEDVDYLRPQMDLIFKMLAMAREKYVNEPQADA